MPEVVRCSSCGQAIIWVTSPSGAAMPLDARPMIVYTIQEQPGARPQAVAYTPPVVSIEFAEGLLTPLTDGAPKLYLNHFVTCPKRDEHSKAKATARGRR